MPIDNDLYNATGDIWWDDSQILSLLRTALNPGRFSYFREALGRLGIDPHGKRTLDIGCGGGLLAEEFARLGCDVIGVDPSNSSLDTAHAHAAQSGLEITYQQAAGESLPFAGATFDIVYCCDVLEHVTDLDRVIAETARVLRPGGIYLYDTINRTLLSKLLVIKMMQEWKATAIMPPNLHDWSMFIEPRELHDLMARHGIESRETVGLWPVANPIRVLATVWQFKRGVIGYGEMGERLAFGRSRSLWASYMGHGVRAP